MSGITAHAWPLPGRVCLGLHTDVAGLHLDAGIARIALKGGLSGQIVCEREPTRALLQQLTERGTALSDWLHGDADGETREALRYLMRARLVTWWYGEPGHRLVHFEPLSGAFDPTAAPVVAERLVLSRLTTIHYDPGGVALDAPLALVRIRLSSDALALLPELLRRGWLDAEQTEDSVLPQTLMDMLAAGGVLHAADAESAFSASWTAHAWGMHRAVRDNALLRLDRDAFDRMKRSAPKVPAHPPRTGRPLVTLPGRDPSMISQPLDRVMQMRRSLRRPGSRPLTLGQLGALLWSTLRFRSERPMGPHGERPKLVPMAGMLGELEVYVAAHRCDGLSPGFYHYEAERHALDPIAPSGPALDALLKDAAQRMLEPEHLPDVVLVFSTRLARLAWKYGGGSYRLTLMNLGVCYEALYLAATDLGLSPCAIGFAQLRHFARLTGRDPFEETSVGELAVSGPAEPETPSP